MRVVLIKLNSLGDNIVFVPVVQEMRRRYPSWELTLLTTPRESELYAGALAPQRLFVSPKPSFNKAYRRPWDLVRWILRIRKIKPDACLVAYDQSNVAHLVAKLSGARVRVGGNLGRIKVPGSLTEPVAMPEDGRPLTWNWRMGGAIVRSLGAGAGWPPEPPAPDLSHLVGEGLAGAGARPRVVIHAGAGNPMNQWPREQFAAVATSLARDYEVVWIEHGPAMAPPPGGVQAVQVTTLAGLAGLIAGADLYLGNNSGPMHMASALGRPGVAVTGPAAHGWDPYWSRGEWTILRHPALACAPCDKTTVALTSCANLESPMACLRYWTAERVEAACRVRLERPKGGSR
jgi:ADP-heptose:LPS heptosyltransferase